MTLAGHCDYVLSLALAAGAPILASAGLRGQICLWDLHACAQTGAQVCCQHFLRWHVRAHGLCMYMHCPRGL